jgi:hypothetical protein
VQLIRTGGVGLAQAGWDGSLGWQRAGHVARLRQQFSKEHRVNFYPQLSRVRGLPVPVELGVASLDEVRGALVPLRAVVLPAPHLDVDPSFTQTRWAAELTTSRRSDHDARVRTT